MMLRRIVAAFAATLASGADPQRLSGQAGPPSTDIYLAPLTTRNGRLVVGAPINVTRRPGYDNQPAFTPDGRMLLYTSVGADGQADIYRYDLRAKTTARVTTTAESEYSPTVYGDGTRFSAIRVEADSTQRLWSFRLDGTDPRLVFDAIKPVGYHTWVDSTTVALFLLGTPNTLLLADTRGGRTDTIARDVGRSLVPLPNGGGFSFTQRMHDSSWVLTAVDVRRTRGGRHSMLLPVARMSAGADYVAWLAPAKAISGSGSKLFLWTRERGPLNWSELADFSRYRLSKISRLAISPDRKWLALVAEPAAAAR
jgi:hypothetical protein